MNKRPVLAKPFAWLWNKWDRIDNWLCIWILPISLRVLWCRLWNRRNKFHECYSVDPEVMLYMSKSQQSEYVKDIVKRRNVVHNRSEPLTQ